MNPVFPHPPNLNAPQPHTPLDYVLSGGHKVGGNAQALTGRRWLHHTSFLWDFDRERMALLRQPAKAPQYRQVAGEESVSHVWGGAI